MRPLTALSLAAWVALVVACTGGSPERPPRPEPAPASAPAAPQPDQAAEPAQTQAPTRPPEPETISPEERARRAEEWRGAFEDRATELAKKGDALEAKLAERVALYKRWAAEKLFSRDLADEIERLKKSAAETWEALAKIEDQIEAGPPETVLAAAQWSPPQFASIEPPAPAAKKPKPPAKAEKPPAPTAELPRDIVYAPPQLKTVNVRGYYRNGHYVQPHMRSSPRR